MTKMKKMILLSKPLNIRVSDVTTSLTKYDNNTSRQSRVALSTNPRKPLDQRNRTLSRP
jgi:hypothetical protein